MTIGVEIIVGVNFSFFAVKGVEIAHYVYISVCKFVVEKEFVHVFTSQHGVEFVAGGFGFEVFIVTSFACPFVEVVTFAVGWATENVFLFELAEEEHCYGWFFVEFEGDHGAGVGHIAVVIVEV